MKVIHKKLAGLMGWWLLVFGVFCLVTIAWAEYKFSPQYDGKGTVGTSDKRWREVYTEDVDTETVTFEGATEDDYETAIQATDPTADRAFTLPDRTGTAALDTLPVIDCTAGVTLEATQLPAIVTNSGATGAVVVTLPSALTVTGKSVILAVAEAQNFDGNPNDADRILLWTDADGDAIRCATVGGSIELYASGTTGWYTRSGTTPSPAWSDVN